MTAAVLTSVKNCPPPMRSLGVVAAFDSPERAESAMTALQSAGFNIDKLSILAKDAQSGEQLFGCATVGSQTRFWGRMGPSWNRIAQRLPGAAVMFVPFIGNVVMLGSVVAWLIEDGPRHGTAEGATPLWRLLARLGVSSHDGSALELALRESDILLVATGTTADDEEAHELLRHTGCHATLSSS